VRAIFSAARAAGKGAGIHFIAGELEQEIDFLRAGANLVIHAADVHLYRRSLSKDIGALRQAMGDELKTEGDETII
jgi:2-keto-3-deoxy-L-rhamnonate aldolase RhmA